MRLLGPRGRTHRRLGLEPEFAQARQHVAENAQRVGFRKNPEGQHHRGIKRGDVAVPHVARHAGEKDVGVAAFEATRLRKRRNRLPLAQIFAEKEAVDLRRVPANDHVLVVVRKYRRLREPGGTQRGGQGPRLPHILQRVFLEGCTLARMRLGDFPGAEFHAVVLGHPEVPRRGLEPEALKFPRGDIVELDEKKRVHHVTPVNLELPVLDQSLGDLQTRRIRPRHAPVATEPQLDPAFPRPRLQVWEIEPENVVSLDHIRIPLEHEGGKLLQHPTLLRGITRVVDHQDFLPSRAVGHGDREQRIAGRIGQRTSLARVRFDVHLHAPQVAELHALEKRPPARKQVLVGGVAQGENLAPVTRLRLGEGGRLVKRHDKAERAGSCKLTRIPRQRLRGPGERLVHSLLDRGATILAAPVNTHAIRGEKFHGHDTGRLVRPEEDGVVLESVHALNLAAPGHRTSTQAPWMHARFFLPHATTRHGIPQ